MAGGFEDDFDDLFDGHGLAVADVDGVAGGVFFHHQQAAADEVGDVQKVTHLVAGAPDDVGIFFEHGAADEHGS